MIKAKKLCLSLIWVFVFMFSFILTGCGEEFIIEQDYQLIGMQVIADNTKIDNYDNWEAGSFHEAIIGYEGDNGTGGSMLVKDCVVQVGKKETKLVWKTGEFKAVFTFKVVSSDMEYPVFAYDSSMATYKNKDVLTLTDSEQNEIPTILQHYAVFIQTISNYETNMQLITQKRTFVAYFSMVDRPNSKCICMYQFYGINI